MKFVDIPSLGLSPGRLTVWRAKAPQVSDGIWVADLRRASHVQEAHITYAVEAAAAGPLPPLWLGCAFELPAELDVDAFSTALRNWSDRHETLRSSLSLPSRSTPDEGIRRMTLPTGIVDIQPSAEGDFTDGGILARRLEELFDDEVSPLSWPGYIFATISRPEATTVCLAADHILIDGLSTLLSAYEIRVLYAEALTVPNGKPALPPLPPTTGYFDFAEAERATANALTAEHASIVRWRQFISEAGGRLPEFPVPVSAVNTIPTAQPGGYAELLDASATHAFDQVCRAAGGDSFSGLLACLGKIGHELTGSSEFRTVAPFNTRTPPWRSSIGWYIGMGPIAFPVNGTDSFAEAIRSADAGLDGVKDIARIPISRVAELLGHSLRDPFMVSYNDGRRMPGARDWDSWRAVILRGRSNDPDEVYFWFLRTYGGLSVSYRHPNTPSAGIAVPQYVARAKHLLACVASTAHWPATSDSTGDDYP